MSARVFADTTLHGKEKKDSKARKGKEDDKEEENFTPPIVKRKSPSDVTSEGDFLLWYYMKIMAHEIETKVLDIDAPVLIKKLEELGAKKIKDTRLVVDWFRAKGDKEGEEPWFLRIRSDSSGKAEATWKARSTILGTARKHKEINFNIPEPEKLADLFLELGLEQYAHQEKDRVSFTYKDWQFDFDTYPGMPAFLEIEGGSEEHVREGMALLGISNNPTWANGERILIQERYKLNWYDMRF